MGRVAGKLRGAVGTLIRAVSPQLPQEPRTDQGTRGCPEALGPSSPTWERGEGGPAPCSTRGWNGAT